MALYTQKGLIDQNMAAMSKIADGRKSGGLKPDNLLTAENKSHFFSKHSLEALKMEDKNIPTGQHEKEFEPLFKLKGNTKINGRTLSSFTESSKDFSLNNFRQNSSKLVNSETVGDNNIQPRERITKQDEQSIKFRATSPVPGIPYSFDLVINFADPNEITTVEKRTEAKYQTTNYEHRTKPVNEESAKRNFEAHNRSNPQSLIYRAQSNQSKTRDSSSDQTLFDGSRLSLLTRAINSEEFASLPLEERYKKQEETIKLYSLFLKKQEKYIQNLLELNSQLSKSVTENIETVDLYIKKNRAKDDIISELEEQIRKLGGLVKPRFSQNMNLNANSHTNDYETAKKSFMTSRNSLENIDTQPKYFQSPNNPRSRNPNPAYDYPRRVLNFDQGDAKVSDPAEKYGSKQDLDIRKTIERAEKSYQELNSKVNEFKTRDSLYRIRESNVSSPSQKPWMSDGEARIRQSSDHREFI